MDSAFRLFAASAARAAGEDAPGRDPAVSAVDELYTALARGDLEAALARLAPAVAWEQGWSAAAIPVRRARRDAGEEARLRGDLAGLGRVQVVRVMAAGSEVAALVADGFAVTAAGQATRRFEVHLWTLDEGFQVTRFRRVADIGRPTRH